MNYKSLENITGNNMVVFSARSSSFVFFFVSAHYLLLFWSASAHPGAVADGRASCGVEYSTPETAYIIPDIQEAWYLRRAATCESSFFWTAFDVIEEGQELYIAVISPEIQRFQDNLKFHAILYGPGIEEDEANGLSAIPDTLPSSIEVAQGLGGAGYMSPPPSLNTCAFVDTNPVMKQFSDLIGGRCMEEFTYEPEYPDDLQQDTTVYNWWLYSFNHRAVRPGKYYLQSWLTTADDESTVAQGKYEMTLGPWSWVGYASEATLDLARSQGTSCSCAVNALDFREQNLDRLGDMRADFFLASLPGGSCSEPLTSACTTIEQKPYRSEGSVIEWSGLWSLEAGKTYEWTFRAYWEGLNATFGYPDPGMFIYAVESLDVESVASAADAVLADAVDLPAESIVPVRGTISYGKSQFIEFVDPAVTTSTTVLFQPTTTATVAVFTQHVPSEFMAHVLVERETGTYVFPTSLTLYSDDAVAPAQQGDDEDTTPSPVAAPVGDPDDAPVEDGGTSTMPTTAAPVEGIETFAPTPVESGKSYAPAPVNGVDSYAPTAAPTTSSSIPTLQDSATTSKVPTSSVASSVHYSTLVIVNAVVAMLNY